MVKSELEKFSKKQSKVIYEHIVNRFNDVLNNVEIYVEKYPEQMKSVNNFSNKNKHDQIIEEVTSLWFIRLLSIYLLDVNLFNEQKILIADKDETQPQILKILKQGIIPEWLNFKKKEILNLTNPFKETSNSDKKIHELVLIEYCSFISNRYPFLFEEEDQWTFILIPIEYITSFDFQREWKSIELDIFKDYETIEIIYRYFQASIERESKKNEDARKFEITKYSVLKKNFPQKWLIQYVTDNTLGRLFLDNNEGANLKKKLHYYVKDDYSKEKKLEYSTPEELKLFDPACGCGTMLISAFNLLYDIYEQSGYDHNKIPELILTKNLFGYDVDKFAAKLAVFIITIIASNKLKYVNKKPMLPNIYEPILKIPDPKAVAVRFPVGIKKAIRKFKEEGDFYIFSKDRNLSVEEVDKLIECFEKTKYKSKMKYINMLKFLKISQQKYHCILCSPMHIDINRMPANYVRLANDKYPFSKYNLYSIVFEKSLSLLRENGYCGIISSIDWMFKQQYKNFRMNLLKTATIQCLVHVNHIDNKKTYEQSVTILRNENNIQSVGTYYCTNGKEDYLTNHLENEFKVPLSRFKNNTNNEFIYWLSDKMQRIMAGQINGEIIIDPKIGMILNNSRIFIRYWYEVNKVEICFDHENYENKFNKNQKWCPYSNGGPFRRWYGNYSEIIFWYIKGEAIKKDLRKKKIALRAENNYFKKGLTYNRVSRVGFSVRISNRGSIFGGNNSRIFTEESNLNYLAGLLNSKVIKTFVDAQNPSISLNSNNLRNIPVIVSNTKKIDLIVENLFGFSKNDWDFYETSWDFTVLPLLNIEKRLASVKDSYNNLRQAWQQITLEMQRLEEENNRIFIEAYGLEDELTPEVPLKEITLTCNPYYRYGVDADENTQPGVFPINQAIENRLQSDTMKEFISYAVGCMFGRYSLDKEGLILANAGDGIEEYLNLVPEPTFKPDESGILPLTEADDFTDDLPSQFYRFLRTTFSEEHYHENLRFIEDSIGKSVRQYFLRDFFKDHVQRYKKRPIYWMVTSPRGSFRAFIYLHRYNKDTVGQILNDYVRPFEKKLESRIAECRHASTASSSGTKEKIQAQKDVDRFEKALQEITEWDAKVLRPLALERIELDLDDGVKVNYAKLGAILEKVQGLNG